MALALDPPALPKGVPLDGPAAVLFEPGSEMRGYLATLLEQVVNSAMVAGITALSMMAATQDVSGKAVSIAFGITFLIELRKTMRKIK